MFDILIEGGEVIDGSGAPRRKADVAIRGGRVVAIGDVAGTARETIDASGRAVCPGFVDIHTHYDAQIFWDRKLSISPWHGVTTCVIGNCGFGIAPTRPECRRLILRTLEKVEGMSLAALEQGLGAEWPFVSFPDYLDAIERRGAAINVAAFVGHTPTRLAVMGEDAVKREATKDEIAAMVRIVREAMDAGAIGFATSQALTHNAFDGHPVPSRKAAFAEIEALAAAMAAGGHGVMQATVGPTLFLDQLETLARANAIPITWTALFAGIAGKGSHRPLLARTHAERDEGLGIKPQVTCRPLNFDFDFLEPFPFESRPLFAPTLKADRRGKEAIYRDAAFRAAFRDDMGAGTRNAFTRWYERTVVSFAPGDAGLEERRVDELAAECGKDPIDFVLDLALASDFKARFRMAALNYDEEDVAELLLDDSIVVALSDAGAHASQLCDACYATHLLGHWVREKGTLGLERAVEMLTRVPADLFGLADRGRLAEGLPADIVVFDPKTVGAGKLRRVHDLPAGADRLVSDAHGIDAVLCNGVVIRRHGRDATEGLPGRLLRGAA